MKVFDEELLTHHFFAHIFCIQLANTFKFFERIATGEHSNNNNNNNNNNRDGTNEWKIQ